MFLITRTTIILLFFKYLAAEVVILFLNGKMRFGPKVEQTFRTWFEVLALLVGLKFGLGETKTKFELSKFGGFEVQKVSGWVRVILFGIRGPVENRDRGSQCRGHPLGFRVPDYITISPTM